MQARDLLLALREGHVVSRDAVNIFAKGLGSEAVSDAQAGAFAMAVCQNGLTDEARVALTLGMRDS